MTTLAPLDVVRPALSRRDLLRSAVVLGGMVAAVPGALRPAAAAAASASSTAATGSALAHAHTPTVVLEWLAVVFDRVRIERASPPSAARIYAAVAVAAYEAIVAGAPGHRSLGRQLNGLAIAPAPRARGTVDWEAAVNAAIARTVAEAFVDRSPETLAALADHAADVHAELVGRHGEAAVAGARHGAAVGDIVASWLSTDGYTPSRGLSYEPPVGPGLWTPTPPNFGAAIEPHWTRVRPMALRDSAECTPLPPVPYDETPGSPFHEQAMAVIVASRRLDDAQRETAMYWRDNPDGITGLPAGHWMQIAADAAGRRDLVGASELLALVGTSIADAFTSCWVEKYRTNLLRPVTYIQRVIDPSWSSFVNSPAFPEYTSGHSVGSGAAARTLTVLVGPMPFTDHGAASRGFTPRSFASYDEAASEAAASRLYGGIHYPMAIDEGLVQGRRVADVVLGRVRTRR